MALKTSYARKEITGKARCATAANARPVVDRARVARARSQSFPMAGIGASVADGIITIDERGVIESFNPAAEKLFGYSAREAIGRNISLLMPSPYCEGHDRYLANYRDTGERKVIGSGREGAGRRKDGSTFPLELTVSESRLGARRLFTGVVLDITRRKQAEETLRERVKELNCLYLIADLIEKEDSLEKILQGSTDVISNAWSHPEIACARITFRGRSYQTGNFRETGWRQSADLKVNGQPVGMIELCYLEERPNRDEGPFLKEEKILLTAIARRLGRVAEHKQAKEALREQTRRYQSLVEVSPDAIFVLKHDRITFINPEGLRLLGAESAGQVLGKSLFDFFHQTRHEVIRQRVGRLSQAGGDSLVVEEELVRSDGSKCWVNLSSAVFTEQGETVVQFILREITERKRLENEILVISDHEQQRIGHDLHDGLGQQLTALEMKCFLLLEDLAADDFPARREQLQEQARQMSQGLRECVTATRSLARGLVPVNLKAGGLMGALEQLAHHIHVPGKIECRFVCHTPVVLDNSQTAGHLYRIAQEAVNNALKHARTRRIHIDLGHKQGALRLQIKDYGRGLPKSRKSKSGMGLEIMRHRAHVIGASLKIDSKPGQGVSVTCTLPFENHEH